MSELLILHNRLTRATMPEEIFGPLAGPADEMLLQVKKSFRVMALIAHPDRSPDAQPLAEITFNLLETWRRRAADRIHAGNYGNAGADPSRTIKTRRGIYLAGKPLAQGDYFTLYACTRIDHPTADKLLLKIVRDPRENDVIERETETLQTLPDDPAGTRATQLNGYLPEIIDTFLAADGAATRRALILAMPAAAVPLTAIRMPAPPASTPVMPPGSSIACSKASGSSTVAASSRPALLPPNLWIDLHNHGLRFAEWAGATPVNEEIGIISNAHAAWYPPEVIAKNPATAATDIYMAARCLIYLLGGDVLTATLPTTVPAPIRRFINGCLLPWSIRRPNDAAELREEFGSLLRQLYGKPAFRPLAIPA